VTVNLVLHEDAALGGVVTALAGLRSQILALRKSEPTLEDVFVELVGRGLGEDTSEADDDGRDGRDGWDHDDTGAGDATPDGADAVSHGPR
jgi:hypothetical protein